MVQSGCKKHLEQCDSVGNKLAVLCTVCTIEMASIYCTAVQLKDSSDIVKYASEKCTVLYTLLKTKTVIHT